MEERQTREFLSRFQVALQGLADGRYSENQIQRYFESNLSFPVIVGALIAGVKYDLLSTDSLPSIKVEFTVIEDKFIGLLFGGNVNSQICQKLDWPLEKVYQVRNRVRRKLEVYSDYQVVAWEAKRRKDLGKL